MGVFNPKNIVPFVTTQMFLHTLQYTWPFARLFVFIFPKPALLKHLHVGLSQYWLFFNKLKSSYMSISLNFNSF